MNGKQARRMRKLAMYNPHKEKSYKEINIRQDLKTGLRTSTVAHRKWAENFGLNVRFLP